MTYNIRNRRGYAHMPYDIFHMPYDICHMTFETGVDTHIWGLDYSFLREVALRRQKVNSLSLPPSLPLPLSLSLSLSLSLYMRLHIPRTYPTRDPHPHPHAAPAKTRLLPRRLRPYTNTYTYTYTTYTNTYIRIYIYIYVVHSGRYILEGTSTHTYIYSYIRTSKKPSSTSAAQTVTPQPWTTPSTLRSWSLCRWAFSGTRQCQKRPIIW